MMRFFRTAIVMSVMALLPWVSNVKAAIPSDVPITTDSRIKTFVYNENEVYKLVLHFGYQSSIEFANGEEVETVSIGDSYAWKVTPVGRRLFIKSMETNAHTNMTVITNRHTYQFDIISRMPDENLDEELVYVVRFFYPGQSQRLGAGSVQASFPEPTPPVPGGR